VRAPTVINSQ